MSRFKKLWVDFTEILLYYTSRGVSRDYSVLVLVALATVGTTEVIKNLVQKGGKRVWTLATIGVGVLMTLAAFFLPEKILYGIVGVSGATVFYDTVFKAFGKIFENLAPKQSETKDER